MNIFYLHPDPIKAPTYLYNKHVVKMILETAQMLCTAHHIIAEQNGFDTSYIPYKKAYVNHPSTIWARSSYANYEWLYDYFVSINIEYYNRYGKIHSTYVKTRQVLYNAPAGISDLPFTQPPQCMPDEYKTDCSVQAYWNYYIDAKKHIANKTEVQHVFRPREIERMNILTKAC